MDHLSNEEYYAALLAAGKRWLINHNAAHLIPPEASTHASSAEVVQDSAVTVASTSQVTDQAPQSAEEAQNPQKKCTFCGKIFLRRWNCKNHMNYCTMNANPLARVPCGFENCTDTFSRKPDKDRHHRNVHKYFKEGFNRRPRKRKN